MAIWDNRCTQHYAVQDFWPAVRNLERAGIVGDRPVANGAGRRQIVGKGRRAVAAACPALRGPARRGAPPSFEPAPRGGARRAPGATGRPPATHGVLLSLVPTARPPLRVGGRGGASASVGRDDAPRAQDGGDPDELREPRQPVRCRAGLRAPGGGLSRRRGQGRPLLGGDAAQLPDARRAPPHGGAGRGAPGVRPRHGGRPTPAPTKPPRSAAGRAPLDPKSRSRMKPLNFPRPSERSTGVVCRRRPAARLCLDHGPAILTLLVGPIQKSLGVNDTSMGLLHGFTFAAFYAIMGLPIARVIDRGNRPTIAVGIAIWSVCTAASGLATDYWHLVAARTGVAVGEAVLIPGAISLLADLFSTTSAAGPWASSAPAPRWAPASACSRAACCSASSPCPRGRCRSSPGSSPGRRPSSRSGCPACSSPC